jgi:hypothetical protein
MRFRKSFALGLSVAAALAACKSPGPGTRRFVDFEKDSVDSPPAAFDSWRTGRGPYGEWLVQQAPDAPSGKNVLAQMSKDPTDKRFPMAILRDAPAGDVRIRAKVKPVSGDVDRAAGLVVRWTDVDNYYITRANALEGNIRLYHFAGGLRTQIGNWDGAVTDGAWHDYAFEVVGDRLKVSWDGKVVIDLVDTTIAAPGRVGLWTKADSVTAFDDVEVTRL